MKTKHDVKLNVTPSSVRIENGRVLFSGAYRGKAYDAVLTGITQPDWASALLSTCGTLKLFHLEHNPFSGEWYGKLNSSAIHLKFT